MLPVFGCWQLLLANRAVEMIAILLAHSPTHSPTHPPTAMSASKQPQAADIIYNVCIITLVSLLTTGGRKPNCTTLAAALGLIQALLLQHHAAVASKQFRV